MLSLNQENSLYQPIFAFSSPQFKSNKLIDKLVPAVQVDITDNLIKCKDADAQVSIIRTQYPLPTQNILAFFEVQIQKCSAGHINQCGLNIGLITKDGNPRAYAGKYMNSIGYFNGQIYLNKKKVGTGPQLSKKDRVGCGINCSNMSFFFTKNKEIIASDITLPQNNKWNEFYPAVALQHQDEIVKCYFQKKDFSFDIEKFSKQIQSQIKAQIFQQDSEQQQIESSQMYSLISEYMLFNGYSKTLQCNKLCFIYCIVMRQKKQQIQFQPINKLTKNIQGTKVLINLDQQNRIQNQADQLLNLRAISDSDDQNQEKKEIIKQQIFPEESRLKSRMRQRIMSDVHPEILQEDSLMVEQENQPRRKNTQALIEQEDIPGNCKLRKQSNISNISLIDDQSSIFFVKKVNNKIPDELGLHGHYNNEKQLEANLFQESLSLNERFLLNQRLQILALIKEEKIECAQKIIREKIPKLYEVEPLLQPYMKAHILLRKIKEQGQKSAIQYGHSQQKISKNIDKLFPTYSLETGMIEMIPMKKILTAITAYKTKDHKFLKKQQFQYFSQYVNSLIMKSMGVMGNSRLGVILEHNTIVLRKLQQFKGMSCGIRLLS